MRFVKHKKYPLKLLLSTKPYIKPNKKTNKRNMMEFSDKCNSISEKLMDISKMFEAEGNYSSQKIKELVDQLLMLKRMDVEMEIPLNILSTIDEGKSFDQLFYEREDEDRKEKKANDEKQHKTNEFYEKLCKLNL